MIGIKPVRGEKLQISANEGEIRRLGAGHPA